MGKPAVIAPSSPARGGRAIATLPKNLTKLKLQTPVPLAKAGRASRYG